VISKSPNFTPGVSATFDPQFRIAYATISGKEPI